MQEQVVAIGAKILLSEPPDYVMAITLLQDFAQWRDRALVQRNLRDYRKARYAAARARKRWRAALAFLELPGA